MIHAACALDFKHTLNTGQGIHSSLLKFTCLAVELDIILRHHKFRII